MENTELYLLAFTGFVTLSVFCIVVFLFLFRKVLQRTNFSSQKKQRILLQVAFTIVFWLLFTGTLSSLGFLEMSETEPVIPPPLLILVNIPLVVILLLVKFNKNLKEILKVVPAHWLVCFQSFRIVVEILIWLVFIQNLLPIQMTFEGKNFDILVGILALPVGYFVSKTVSIPQKKKLLLVWNVFGLLLLATIIIISVLSAPLPIRFFINEPSAKVVATFPFVWLPTVLVVIAYSLHILSLAQIGLLGKTQS